MATASSAFTGSENPLSESGVWTNATVGGLRKISGFAQAITASANSYAGYTGISWTADQYSRVTRGASGTLSSTRVGACVRLSNLGISNILGYGFAAFDNFAYVLFRLESGGTQTAIGPTYTELPAVADVIELRAVGSTITPVLNGTPLASATDSTYATGVPGIFTFNGATSDCIDAWEGGDIGGGDTTPPTITITSPTSSPTHATSAPSIAMGGTASDAVGVTSVSWVNDRGGGGAATGTTTWSIASVALFPLVNVITVTAFDAAGNSGSDILTVTYTPTTLPIDPPDRPALAVEWLVDVGSTVKVGTWTNVSSTATYLPRLLTDPQISRDMADVGSGFSTEVARARGLRIANHDGAYDALWDARGLPVTIRRHDRLANVTVTEFEGVVDSVILDAGDASRVPAVEIEAFNQDLTVLETHIPKRVTSTTLFGTTCPNPGVAIPKIVGNVPLVPLIYVRDDVPGGLFDYLVGEGTGYTIVEVRRDRIGDQQPQLLTGPEYSVVTYSGVTVIRTVRRQLKGGGGFHQLYATVQGPAGERNPATFAGVMMGDTTWGLGLTVNAASITAAAALIPAGLVIDGVLDVARPAVEWLRMVLELRGARPTFSPTLGWGLTVDAPPASAKMALRDEAGPGERTMLAHGRRRRPGLNEDVATLRLEYAPNLLTGRGYTYEASPRTVSAVGAERRRTHDLLRDRTAADIFACYLALKMRDPDVVEGAAVHEEGRRLMEGDVVNVTSTRLQLVGVDRQILAIDKGSGRQTLRHRRYSPADYVYTAGTLPPLQAIDSSSTPPAAPTGVSLSTGITLIDGRYVTWGEATWNRNTEPDMARYYVRSRQLGTATWISAVWPHPDSGATVTQRLEAHLPTTMTFEVQVLAEDMWENRSAWAPTTPVQITIAADLSPATPTGLSLTTGIESVVAQDGSYLAWVQATWTRNGESDILRYNVQGRITGAANWEPAGAVEQTVSGSPVIRWQRQPPNVSGEVRVQAEDRDGHLSAWSAAVAITNASFSTAPAAPTGVAAAVTALGFRITWNRVAEAGIKHYEIHEGTSSGFSITGTGEVLNGTCIAHTGGASYVKVFGSATSFPITRHYKIVAVRVSGTGGIRGAESAVASATASGITSGDIGTGQVQTSNIAAGAISQQGSFTGSSPITVGTSYTSLGSITRTTSGGTVELIVIVNVNISTASTDVGPTVTLRIRNSTLGTVSGVIGQGWPLGATVGVPLSCIMQEQPSAGTYTWVMEMSKGSNATISSSGGLLTFKEFRR